jgi:hypothetical protein
MEPKLLNLILGTLFLVSYIAGSPTVPSIPTIRGVTPSEGGDLHPGNNLLLNTGDNLLLNTGDALLLNG